MTTAALALDEIHVRNCKVYPSRELMVAALPHDARVAEIGTQAGVFARHILKACDPAELHLYDRDAKTYEPIEDPRVSFHRGDSATELEKMPDDFFDWVYIDADHSYEGVWRDVGAAQTVTKDYGYLAFNDYTLWSVLERAPYGVVQVVNQLLVNERYEMTHFAFQPLGYHDVVLRRRA